MDALQKLVREFHDLAGDDYPTHPTFPTPATTDLRARLIDEEAFEAVVELVSMLAPRSLGREAVQELQLLTSVAHELADLLYVTYGAASALGIDIDPIFRAIHAANMQKVNIDGELTRRADGKIMKPEGWQPADVVSLVKQQIADADPVPAVSYKR